MKTVIAHLPLHDGLPSFVTLRFQGCLNDFLRPVRRKKSFRFPIRDCPAVKDTLEAAGVPHVEIDAIAVNQDYVGFDHRLRSGDVVKVYPAGLFENSTSHRRRGRRLQPDLPSPPRFVCDGHLGKLARDLRLLGFDTVYRNVFPDEEIARLASSGRRIVLTRDVGLLKNKKVRHGHWVRATDPPRQRAEIVRLFKLGPQIAPFRRCLVCNGLIRQVTKKDVLRLLPSMTVFYYQCFHQCRSCRKVYWRGSHDKKLMKIVGGSRGPEAPDTD